MKEICPEVRKSIEKTLTRLGLKYVECTTWTTDSIFRETKEMIKYRKSEGCQTVEMECSALASVAKFRNVMFGQLLFTADSLANLETYDSRGFGKDVHADALNLCMEIILDF